ncbi:MAG: Hsp20/alpha crystallin family protein [Hyphomonadaceae bacterium]
MAEPKALETRPRTNVPARTAQEASPFGEIDHFMRSLRTRPFFSGGFDVSPFFAANAFPNPAVDVVETEKVYEITVELPGVDEKDVEITHSDGVLTIKGRKSEEQETKRKDYYVSERRFGSFERSFRMPDLVDEEKIAAEYDHGVLKISLPKAPGLSPAARSVPIKSSK